MSSTTSSTDLKRLSLWFWLGLCAAFVASALTPEHGLAGHMLLATTWFLAGLAPFAWVTYDRREAGRRLTTPGKYGLIVLGPVFLLPYVLRTRGLGKGIVLTLVFAIKFIGVLLLAIVILSLLSLSGLVPLPT